MKVILLIGLLAGYAVALQADEHDPSREVSSSGVNASFPPQSFSQAQTYSLEESDSSAVITEQSSVEGTDLVSVISAEPSSPELWTGLKLERDMVRAAPFKTAPAPKLYSAIALIYDQETQRPLYTKNAKARAPIASITKLMTAMVILDARQPLDEIISIETADIDMLKRTPSRLAVGMTFTRNEMLSLALMASENRAASALARAFPGGKAVLVDAMNAKALELGMEHTHFTDPAGLSDGNISTAQDLVRMVSAASKYALIHQYTTATTNSVDGMGGRELRFNNTNPLVRNVGWNIGLSKTGFINEAGKCLVMEATINQRSVIIVLLNSWGRKTRIGDANRIKRWMEKSAEMRSNNPERS